MPKHARGIAANGCVLVLGAAVYNGQPRAEKAKTPVKASSAGKWSFWWRSFMLPVGSIRKRRGVASKRTAKVQQEICDTVEHKFAESEPSSGADARIVKTDHALRTALLALLERSPFEQITVRQITAEAGVHYATFFRHHSTKEALLDHVAADQIDRLVELTVPIFDLHDSQAAFVKVCAYVSEHRRLWTTLLTGGAARAMREEHLRMSKIVARDRASKENLWIPVDLAVICTVSLMMDTLTWWLTRPADELSIQDVATILDRVVSSFGAR
jgi:AcrR family transcriptional regulator